jgi:STE24 endopeptidase
MSIVELDSDRQREAKEYARIRRRLMLVDLGLGAGYALVWLLSGASIWLRDQIMGLTQQPLLLVALYALLDAPLSYYRCFVLPHHYGLSTQTLRAWLWDQVKEAAIGGVLGLVLLEVMYALLRVSPGWWWLDKLPISAQL